MVGLGFEGNKETGLEREGMINDGLGFEGIADLPLLG